MLEPVSGPSEGLSFSKLEKALNSTKLGKVGQGKLVVASHIDITESFRTRLTYLNCDSNASQVTYFCSCRVSDLL
jgi:hypothetical protein